MNNELRYIIAKMVYNSGEGHIPSSYSIVDIINYLYKHVLSYDLTSPNWENRDYFVLSKGHGCGALWAVLNDVGFVSDEDLSLYSTYGGILGGHPDASKVPGVEASTGSLGHGFPFAVGIALGLKIKSKKNKVFALLGDGECQEGTVWEGANIAANQGLGNICALVDWNKSAQQLMPVEDLMARWKSFGWNTRLIDGHDDTQLERAIAEVKFEEKYPNVIISKNVKGKGVSFIEGHGAWHHKIPNKKDMEKIKIELGIK